VPLEELLVRFVHDANKPAPLAAFMQLLRSTLYPQRTDGQSAGVEQLDRCLTLTETHAAAAKIFYSELHRTVSVGSAAKIVVLLFTHLVNKLTEQDEVSLIDIGIILYDMCKGGCVIYRSLPNILTPASYMFLSGRCIRLRQS
jgi:hypothetical protein